MRVFLITIIFVIKLFSFDPSSLMLLKNYSNQNILGYFMSEKLDGVRGYWDGDKLYTRSGNEFSVPKYFIKDFPPFALDGELWMGRGEFERTLSNVMSKNSDWAGVGFYVFDAPTQNGQLLDRLSALKQWLDKNPNEYIFIITQITIKDKSQVDEFLQKVVHAGGEGVVLRDGSYKAGRTNSAYKYKLAHDSECEVISHKFKDEKFSSLECNDKGVRFFIGSGFSQKLRENPPKIGSIITYGYYSKSKNNIPKSAFFIRHLSF